jgi:hypothetical protein
MRKTKFLLPSPAYRRAGFTKGRNSPSLAKRRDREKISAKGYIG